MKVITVIATLQRKFLFIKTVKRKKRSRHQRRWFSDLSGLFRIKKGLFVDQIRWYIRFFMFADTLERRCFSFKAVLFHLLEEFETNVNFISSIYEYSATMEN